MCFLFLQRVTDTMLPSQQKVSFISYHHYQYILHDITNIQPTEIKVTPRKGTGSTKLSTLSTPTQYSSIEEEMDDHSTPLCHLKQQHEEHSLSLYSVVTTQTAFTNNNSNVIHKPCNNLPAAPNPSLQPIAHSQSLVTFASNPNSNNTHNTHTTRGMSPSLSLIHSLQMSKDKTTLYPMDDIEEEKNEELSDDNEQMNILDDDEDDDDDDDDEEEEDEDDDEDDDGQVEDNDNEHQVEVEADEENVQQTETKVDHYDEPFLPKISSLPNNQRLSMRSFITRSPSITAHTPNGGCM